MKKLFKSNLIYTIIIRQPKKKTRKIEEILENKDQILKIGKLIINIMRKQLATFIQLILRDFPEYKYFYYSPIAL